jgi:hypothetical protein
MEFSPVETQENSKSCLRLWSASLRLATTSQIGSVLFSKPALKISLLQVTDLRSDSHFEVYEFNSGFIWEILSPIPRFSLSVSNPNGRRTGSPGFQQGRPPLTVR